jgi:chlorite dismutase
MVQVSAAELERLRKIDAKMKLSARRSAVKNLIYVEMAKAAGITVSKADVDSRIAAEDAKKASEAATSNQA